MSNITAFSVFDDNFKDIEEVAIPHNRKYFDFHGIEFLTFKNSSDIFIPKSITGDCKKYWTKIFILDKLMKENKNEWIFFIDVDAVFLNPSIPLKLFIELSEKNKELILCETNQIFNTKYWNVNTGVFFVKNTEYMQSIVSFLIDAAIKSNCEKNRLSCEQPLIQFMLQKNHLDLADKTSIFPSHAFNHDGNFIFHPCNFSTLDMNFNESLKKKLDLIKEKLKPIQDKEELLWKTASESANMLE